MRKDSKKEMLYNITNEDLLNNPEKYQRFPFLGKEFLQHYEQNRISIINERKNKSVEIINEFEKIIIPQIINNENNLRTREELIKNFLKILNGEEFEMELNLFIKKFEITRKIFEEYSNDYKTEIGSFYDLTNYIWLSLCVLFAYEKSSNLKYLNTSLKINDVICSQNNLLENNKEINQIFVFLLQKELECVKKLAIDKGVI